MAIVRYTLDIKVVDNNGADISDLATIYFNGQVIDGTSFSYHKRVLRHICKL